MNYKQAVDFIKSEYEKIFFEDRGTLNFKNEITDRLERFFSDILNFQKNITIKEIIAFQNEYWGISPENRESEMVIEVLNEGNPYGLPITEEEKMNAAKALLGDTLLFENLFISLGLKTNYIQKQLDERTPLAPGWNRLKEIMTKRFLKDQNHKIFFKNSLFKRLAYLSSLSLRAIARAITSFFKNPSFIKIILTAAAGGSLLWVSYRQLSKNSPLNTTKEPKNQNIAALRHSVKSNEAVVLRWKFQPNMSVNLVKQGTVQKKINGKIFGIYQEKNIVNFNITNMLSNRHASTGVCEGIFKTFQTFQNSPAHLKQVFNETFKIHQNGTYDVPSEARQPTIRSIPAFPLKPVAPGETWKNECSFLYSEMNPPFMLITNAYYKYLSNIYKNNQKLAVIQIIYQFAENVKEQIGTTEPRQLSMIYASNHAVMLWDVKKGYPLQMREQFDERFILNNNETQSYKMNFLSEWDITYPFSQKEQNHIKKKLSALSEDKQKFHVWTDSDGIYIDIGSVFFDHDSAVLKPEMKQLLKNAAEILEKYKSYEFIFEGHTDSTGADSYNKKLSLERARSTAAWMYRLMPEIRKKSYTEGRGSSRPAASNETEKGRQRNRRVTIKIRQSGQ